MTPIEQLALEMPNTRGAHPAWVSSLWMGREVPAGLGDPAMIGALARLPYCGDGEQSEAQLRARTRRLLQARDDRGWGALIEVMANPHRVADSSYWLRMLRSEWPPALLRWPEERVKAMTFLMREQPKLGPSNAVALFETVETRAELTLARWLTGRTWAKGSRVVEVMEAAHLSLAESPRYTSLLWRQLCKDQRTWLTKSLIEVIDGEYPRDLWKWFNVLDFMRVTHAHRT